MIFGIDTSNYTTSAALLKEGRMYQSKMLLPVKDGERGLRQSEAVFHHVNRLAQVTQPLLSRLENKRLSAIGVSCAPRSQPGSYMPCFTVGLGTAKILADAMAVPLYTFSHQQGHIAAALYGAGKLSLLRERFLAFHVSGGTTEALLVTPDEGSICKPKIVAKTLDLNAGQAIDRVGVMLGLSFPCGKELEALALQCKERIKIKPALKGADCCLSGIENICKRLIAARAPKEYIALYCIKYIEQTLFSMCETLLALYGTLPVLFAGGVMSNTIIRKTFTAHFPAVFASAAFSCDNAAGVTALAAIRENEL